MPELRKDPVVGRWVIIATERARRPGSIVDTSASHPQDDSEECLFCNNQEAPLFTLGDAKVVPYKNSFLSTEQKFLRRDHGMYDVINGYGVHEVVIETSRHEANMADFSVEKIRDVFQVYAHRLTGFQKDSTIQFALAYKNYGATAGSRKIGHARSHIIGTPVNPIHLIDKLLAAKDYYIAQRKCIYCDLINQEEESQKRMVMETDHFVAFAPFAGRFLFEVWILPKEHHCDYTEGIQGKEEDLAYMMKVLLNKFKIGLDDPSYNYMIQTAPFRRGLSVAKKWKTIKDDFHWHIELMPRLTQLAGFEKGTDFYISPVPPEKTADYLKRVKVDL